MPLAHRKLPGEFAKLANGNTQNLLRFVQRYGHLGYAESFNWLELIGASSQRLHNPKIQGDPVAWVLSHARQVNLVMGLRAALADNRAISARLQELVVKDSKTGAERLLLQVAQRGYTYPSESSFRIFDDPRETALQIISTILNNNLDGIPRGIIIEWDAKKRRRELSSIFEPQNLLDSIYWLLADAVVMYTVKICKYHRCQRPFVATNERMEYCPPPIEPGKKIDPLNPPVSPCLNRAKQDKFRNKNGKRRRKKP
jgi:hypothetical protein